MDSEPTDLSVATGAESESHRAADRKLDRRIRVMLLISSLGRGGAERQVVQLANELDPDRFDVCVCSLSGDVPLAEGLRNREGRLHLVQKTWRFDVSPIMRVAGLLHDLRIDVIHAFLFDAEMVARLAAKLARTPVVISSERNSDRKRPLIHTVCLRLTDSWFDAMIANSHAGKRFNMRTLGVQEHRIYVVRNGVDVTRFRPQDRASARRKLGIAPDRPVVGMVAKLSPQKNHLMFLRMAQRVLDEFPEALFLCIGPRLGTAAEGALALKAGATMHSRSDAYRVGVLKAVDELGIKDRCLLLGPSDDMVGFYNACDLTVLTSRHEGTPNVLLESMACGVPVVATDVSDNTRIVPDGTVGFVVGLDDVGAMASKVGCLLSDQRRRAEMGCAARAWIMREFSTTVLARKTEAVYEAVLGAIIPGGGNGPYRA